MSLINDALRRAARPAPPRNREGDRAEGVIAALGYERETVSYTHLTLPTNREV